MLRTGIYVLHELNKKRKLLKNSVTRRNTNTIPNP
jgi:hypothetical protein